MSLKALEILQDHRGEMLRAELAGWFHVAGRLRPEWRETANKQAFCWRPAGPTVDIPAIVPAGQQDGSQKAREQLNLFRNGPAPFNPHVESALKALKLELPSETWGFENLLSLWKEPFTRLDRKNTKQYIPHVMSLSGLSCQTLELFHAGHSRASQMKDGRDAAAHDPAGQDLSDTFGFMRQVKWPGLDHLQDLIVRIAAYGRNPDRDGRDAFTREWKAVSDGCWAHSEKPVNDVTVWDYGHAVGAFFKAAVAKVWIEDRFPGNVADVRWGLAAIGYPGLEFVSSAVRISDALARRDWVEAKFNKVRDLLEYEYPIGNEIYRDENCVVFLIAKFPDCEAVFGEIAGKIVQPEDDLLPSITFQFEADGKLPIWEVIRDAAAPRPLTREQIAAWWKGSKPAVLCPVCQLRPRGGDKTTEGSRNLCTECFTRRQNLQQSKSFLAGAGDGTIWIDETSDKHHICALLVGKLHIEDWLTQDLNQSLFRLLPIRPGETPEGSKEPSFIRIAGCWKAAEGFWRAVDTSCMPEPNQFRLRLRGRLTRGSPAHSHVYEAAFGGENVSAVWDKREGGFFVTASPLRARGWAGVDDKDVLNFHEPREYRDDNDAGHHERRERPPDGDIEFTVEGKPERIGAYRPVIPLIRAPRHFMAIVPADKATDNCRKILNLYKERLGRVSALLPISLGVVFFDRRTPIYAVLQAGSKMLRMSGPKLTATVGVAKIEIQRGGNPQRISLGYGPLDKYYSRVIVPSGAKAIAGLALGDKPQVSVSCLDFTHLETTGRRYELAYDADALRLDPDRPTRALTLDDFERLERLWAILSHHLTTTQINRLFTTSEQLRLDWDIGKDTRNPAYIAFLRALVHDAEWKGKPVIAGEMESLVFDIADGFLRDAVELHLKILKEKNEEPQ